MQVSHGPTGGIIKGHVLDSSVKYVEHALQAYDEQLYLKWNSQKLRGHGCWEVRWRPTHKTIRWSKHPEFIPLGRCVWTAPVQGDIYEFDGYTIAVPKYHETNLNNHVMDVPFVNYDILAKIKKMDVWAEEFGAKGKNLTKELHYKEAKYLDKIEDNALKERDYALKQHKSEIQWFKEFLNSGGNPYRLADHWK